MHAGALRHARVRVLLPRLRRAEPDRRPCSIADRDRHRPHRVPDPAGARGYTQEQDTEHLRRLDDAFRGVEHKTIEF